MTIAVRCEGLSKFYGPVRALDNLNLEIGSGEILTLLGPSGCGKSTTLRLVAGLSRPDAGLVRLGQHIVSDAADGRFVPPERRQVGMVFQDFALFPHLTAAQNVAFGLRSHDRAARTAHVARMLALVGLGGLGGRLPHELSGGQQQRVALARAMAPNPTVLLLDEPFSNLDARMRRLVREEVRDILRGTETTTMFVTHDQQEALFMGDRVAVLNGGRLEQVDTPERVFQRPATHFVADFLGHARFLRGRTEGIGPRAARVRTALGVLLGGCSAPPGTEVQVLVRPDDITVEESDDGEAIVKRRAYQGIHTSLRIGLFDGEELEVLVPGPSPLVEGDRVIVKLRQGRRLSCFHRGVAEGEDAILDVGPADDMR